MRSLQDLRYAARSLRKNPGFAAVAILSLALGIGATVTIYSVLDAVVLRPLPVDKPDRLVLLHLRKPQAAASSFSYPLFRQMRAEQTVLEDMLGAAEFELRRAAMDNTSLERPACRLVTRNYFQVLGVRLARGRAFQESDPSPAVIISDAYWKRTWDRSPEAIGSTLTLNDVPLSVAGIAPPDFTGDAAGVAPDVFVPVDLLPQLVPGINWLTSSRSYWLWTIGRLKPGISMKDAEAALSRLNTAPNTRLQLEPGARGLDHLRRQYGDHLRVLMAGVCLLLLVACANVANLLLARGAARQKEIAIRKAVGADGGRIVRQLLTESLVLSLLAGAAGVVIAQAAGRMLVGMVSFSGQAVELRAGIDLRVLGFTLAVCLLTTLLFGLAPALRAGRSNLTRSISSGWQEQDGHRRYLSGRSLVALQAALSVVLIAGSVLLVRSLSNLRSLDPGFTARDVTTAQLSFEPTREGLERLIRVSEPLEARLKVEPGVRAASVSLYPMLSQGWQSNSIAVPGRQIPEAERIHVNQVTCGFFDTYRIPLLRGRAFTRNDQGKVAVINEELARRYLSPDDPIGRSVGLDGSLDPQKTWTVIGVARNTKYHDLREEVVPQIYLPIAASEGPGIFVGVRTEPGRAVTNQQIAKAVAGVDPIVGVRKTESLTEHVESTLEKERLMARLAVVLTLVALALACAGMYGTMAYSVARRTREIGLRMALGAAPLTAQAMILREALRPAVTGIVVGLPFAIGGAYLVRSLLFGIDPASPVAFTAAAIVILAAALLAAWIPARWASKVDPMTALRTE